VTFEIGKYCVNIDRVASGECGDLSGNLGDSPFLPVKQDVEEAVEGKSGLGGFF